MKLQNVKGFKDYLPQEALRRKIIVDKISQVFERFGFVPIETPTLEFAEVLQGKYGEEEKLIFEFTTKGGDLVALPYDRTVPLARVIAQYPQLPKPFKRYQIQNNFRGENPQKGRLREFTQCDADIIGAPPPIADAEILGLVYEIYKELNLDVIIKINDRQLLSAIEPKYLSALDKLNKIGESGVIQELISKGLTEIQASDLLNKTRNSQPTPNLQAITKLFQQIGYSENILEFDPLLVRGLDYYTGMILEVVLRGESAASSLCGGGRYDQMIAKLGGSSTPAVGFAIGLDRTINALQETGQLNIPDTATKVLVTVFSADLLAQSLQATAKLRQSGLNTEIYLLTDNKLDKQLKYADMRNIPYVLIIGSDEISKNLVTLKNLQTQQQETISLDEVIKKLS
ncbi:histidine--tRNA ligase [Patescibacteria group bacterium]|nr:histidine--tRNA ligase [Patescibacteria group bacterium]MCL5409705.1 histidine--tRNA ligase [Patescibacteria group bacterium]